MAALAEGLAPVTAPDGGEGSGSLRPAAALAEFAKAPAQPAGSSGGQGKRKAKGKTKGKGKAKGKGKGKAKAKGSAKAAARAALAITDEGDAELPAPRNPRGRMDIRARLVAEVGDRDIDEVIAEAKAEVASCESSVEEATKRLFQDDEKIKREVEEAAAAVEAAKLKEAQTLQKLRESHLSRKQVICGVAEAKEKRAEAIRTLKLLELEREGRDRLKELEEAKRAAADAALVAKKALEEARAREKEVLEAQRARQAEALHELEQARRGEKAEEKLAAKRATQQIGDLEKARAQRERAWRKRLLALGAAATPVMIEDAPAGTPASTEAAAGLEGASAAPASTEAAAGLEGASAESPTPAKRRASSRDGPAAEEAAGARVGEPAAPAGKRRRADGAE
ncbi:unnamed protein product [Prorocentrum cordatum]|uniref:Uncharacterized protein n=1 Tax=Prorocentrum cordatum TaxID=2364126 RepID=A0ABN9QV37_9DINO|nr:unnamed protein product [Polarella glacialis]